MKDVLYFYRREVSVLPVSKTRWAEVREYSSETDGWVSDITAFCIEDASEVALQREIEHFHHMHRTPDTIYVRFAGNKLWGGCSPDMMSPEAFGRSLYQLSKPTDQEKHIYVVTGRNTPIHGMLDVLFQSMARVVIAAKVVLKYGVIHYEALRRLFVKYACADVHIGLKCTTIIVPVVYGDRDSVVEKHAKLMLEVPGKCSDLTYISETGRIIWHSWMEVCSLDTEPGSDLESSFDSGVC